MHDSHGDFCEGRVLRLCHCTAIMYFTFQLSNKCGVAVGKSHCTAIMYFTFQLSNKSGVVVGKSEFKSAFKHMI